MMAKVNQERILREQLGNDTAQFQDADDDDSEFDENSEPEELDNEDGTGRGFMIQPNYRESIMKKQSTIHRQLSRGLDKATVNNVLFNVDAEEKKSKKVKWIRL